MRHIPSISDAVGLGETVEDVFERRGALSRQSAAFRAALTGVGRARFYARNEQIYNEGDGVGGVYGVMSGGIGVLAGPPHISPRIIHILRAGDWFGYGPFLRGGGRTLGFVAVEPSELMTVTLAALGTLERKDPEQMRHLGAIASLGAELGADIIAQMTISSSAKRLAATLLRLTGAAEGVQPDHPNGFLLSQTMLAEISSTSRNLVNCTCKKFRAQGWIRGRYNRIQILDAAGLAGFAYSDN